MLKHCSSMQLFIGLKWLIPVCGLSLLIIHCIITTTCPVLLQTCSLPWTFFCTHKLHEPILKTCMFGDVSSLAGCTQASKMETSFSPRNIHWFAPHHSLLVPLILNPQTGKISPQFHVVFDDWFTSVTSICGEDAFNPSQWQQHFTDNCYQYIFDDNKPVSLSDE